MGFCAAVDEYGGERSCGLGNPSGMGCSMTKKVRKHGAGSDLRDSGQMTTTLHSSRGVHKVVVPVHVQIYDQLWSTFSIEQKQIVKGEPSISQTRKFNSACISPRP